MGKSTTEQFLALMQKELDDRRIRLRPLLLEEVKTARAFGDLSENFEYKAAKREKNKNESRIRYLENMIKTARVVAGNTDPDVVGLYDFVTVYLEEDEEEVVYQMVTTVRQDPLQNRISNRSPFGVAVLGKKAGDRVWVQVNDSYGYFVVIRAIRKGEDDPNIPINSF
jgi:transcription elongation factor GreA